MPMSSSAVVNRAEVLEMLGELKEGLDHALDEAQQVLAQRDTLLAEGRAEADEMLREARNERERLVSDSEVFRVAKREADELLERTRTECDELRTETDDYVDGKLANFEITLERTLEAVRRGRDRLAGRSVLDSLTAEEVDKIKLPEHLEG